jgi:glyoxylase-like metal-dependent hydrolase (beta-lactamase superfamily II)
MAMNKQNNSYFEVARNVWGMKDIFVNIYMVKNENDGNWALIDTGLVTSATKIKKMASSLFGDTKPSAIILTHGHFDHRGSVMQLAALWKVPVYAHYLELPYLTGRSSYPPPDSTVGGGMMAWMSFLYPKKPVNIQQFLQALPTDHSVPVLTDWKYIDTPGHSPGHISLFREPDKVLIAGDAFVTTKQESALAVMKQTKQLSGPPKYFTYDWKDSEKSVAKLATLNPSVAATGHGKPMYGEELRNELNTLVNHFKQVAVPSQGRYVNEPAVTDVNGVLYIPPLEKKGTQKWIIAATVIIATSLLTGFLLSKKMKRL